MICNCCRRAFATVHLTDLDGPVGNTGKACSDLCRNCHNYHMLGCRGWVCTPCGESVDEPPRVILQEAETGVLAYHHPSCALAPVASGRWVQPEGMVRVREVAAATPEAAEALGLPHRPPPPGVQAALLQKEVANDTLEVQLTEPGGAPVEPPAEKQPVGFTAEPCDCELRNRAWDPTMGRCRTCGRFYDDPRYPLCVAAAQAREVCRYCRGPVSPIQPGNVLVLDFGRQFAHDQCIPPDELPS